VLAIDSNGRTTWIADFEGRQGVCLSEAARRGLWAISPDNSDEIVSLVFEKDFGLLMDLSGNPDLN
jgi:hypothetical protein